jgi:hypothetical protein
VNRKHAFLTLPFVVASALGATTAHAQSHLQAPSAAKASAAMLHGQVTDPSGAVIPGATISVTDAQGHTVANGTSGGDGSFLVANIPPGAYIVFINAPGFGSLSTRSLNLTAGVNKLLNATLIIQVQQQNVQVNSDAPTVSVDPDANANSVTIKGKDLDALSDDPDELSNELTALAGPAAGPSGGQIYIDGFTGGQLPPKSAIREIRVNKNPYGAQFDKLGFGRVEVFTKPGTDKFHGEFYGQGNTRQFNTGNPFAQTIPDYDSYQYEGTVSGPINKNASFFITAQHRNIQDDSIVDAVRLLGETNGDFAAGNFNNLADYGTATFRDALNTPQTRTNVSPRIDMQLTDKNSLTVRYQYERNVLSNQGVGQFSLTSQAYKSQSSESKIQLIDTEVFGPRVISESHLQILFDRSSQSPTNTTPQVQVQGNQTFGGQSEQSINDHTDAYELSNLTELALKTHSISIGGRLRATREANAANSSFNGTFTFGSRTCPTPGACPFAGVNDVLSASQVYATTLYGQAQGLSFQQIQQQGGGPSQLAVISGNPKVEDNLVDGALFYQDDWKVRPNITFSYGLRWESQDNIHDHSDFAPRLALAYGLTRNGKPTKDVIRAGFGYFYDRFGISQVLQADRVNGIVQKETVLQNPSCYLPNGVPSGTAALTAACQNTSGIVSTGGGADSTVATYTINPNLHAPLNIQESIGLDHQLTKSSTLSLTYIHSHGSHALDTINANAPYSPTYDAVAGNVYQYYSEGVYNQNQFFVNARTQINHSLSVFGYYGLNYARGDVNGVGSLPSSSINLKQDYGRAGFDVRSRLFMVGSYSAPHYFRFSPFIVAQAGNPFNITLSQDLNGDSFFNDRPSFAAAGSSGANIVSNSYGNFNTAPAAGTKPIPVNYGNGPSLVSVNLRVSKTWGFGKRLHPDASAVNGGGAASHGGGGGGEHRGGGGGGGPFGNDGNTGRRYNVTLNAQALNLFNIANYAAPTGTIDSSLFGKSNALAGQIFSSPNGSASRRIFLQARLTF